MKLTFACLALLVLCAGCAAVRESAGPPLQTPRFFAFGPTGVAGGPSGGETAFRETLGKPGAEAAFLAAVHSGNPQGKCYGLVGLRQIHSTQFTVEAARLGKRAEVVTLAQGCIVTSKPLGQVVGDIYAGKYDDVTALPATL